MSTTAPTPAPADLTWACCSSSIGPVCQHKARTLHDGTHVVLTSTPYSADGVAGTLRGTATEGYYGVRTIVRDDDGTLYRTEGIVTYTPAPTA